MSRNMDFGSMCVLQHFRLKMCLTQPNSENHMPQTNFNANHLSQLMASEAVAVTVSVMMVNQSRT